MSSPSSIHPSVATVYSLYAISTTVLMWSTHSILQLGISTDNLLKEYFFSVPTYEIFERSVEDDVRDFSSCTLYHHNIQGLSTDELMSEQITAMFPNNCEFMMSDIALGVLHKTSGEIIVAEGN